MPTASQAMILMTEEGCDPRVPRRHAHEDPKPTDISFLPVDLGSNRRTREKVFVSNENAVFEPIKIPGTLPHNVVLKGYKGNMYYDPESKRFRWYVSPKKDDCVNESLLNSIIKVPVETKDQTKTISSPIKPEKNVCTVHNNVQSLPAEKPTFLERQKNIAHPETSTCSPPKEKVSLAEKYGVKEDVYAKLEGLGFRRRVVAPPPKHVSTRDQSKSAPNVYNVKKGILKHPERETTSTPALIRHAVQGDFPAPAPQNSPRALLNRTFTLNDDERITKSVNFDTDSDEEIVSTRTLSLLDEIKQKVAYDNRIFPAMYMRKSLPEESPLSVCFSLRDPESKYTHSDVKMIVEEFAQSPVIALQYDAVSVRGGCSSDMGSRWIVTLPTVDDCQRLIQSGISMGGEKIVVKWLDDVLLCENDAYFIHQNSDLLMKKKISRRNRKRTNKHSV